MAGIYVHIPFCHSKCSYCNFYFSTCLNHKTETISAICKELILQKNYLDGEQIDTIYFGGGTPSILTIEETSKILDTIAHNFAIDSNAEISLEANPCDLITDKVMHLKNIGINRLSVGLQTFNRRLLKLLNRIDTIKDIYTCIDKIKQYDFKNFNIDIIFAIFGQNIEDLAQDLKVLLEISPPHISAYMLTVEPKTMFYYYLNKKIYADIDDDVSSDMFLLVDKTLKDAGYIHYEISNFCKKGCASMHNFNYWRNKKYLGVGPSAHSYNLISRQWNVSNNILYIKSICNGKIPATKEILTTKDKINEYVFKRLRTIDGIDLQFLKDKYTYTIDSTVIQGLFEEGLVNVVNDNMLLTPKGMLVSNKIFTMLFV